jgi:ribosomal protein L23
MQDESNPIKDYLFDYLAKSDEKIQKLISDEKFSEIIDDVITNCYDKIITLGDKDECIGVLATGLLHFLLTNALLNSQRKIEYEGIEIDIVIPDLKTLEKDPKQTLIICIPKTSNKERIEQKLEELYKIQPEKQNVLLVLSQKLDFENRSYIIEKDNQTFSKIIFDIAQFVNVQGQNKFKILRI